MALMDNEMIERCVSAFDTERKRLVALPLGRIQKELVVAIIKAMREPTDSILGAIHGSYPDVPDKFAAPIAEQRWQAAIDAIIGDK
jgi:hypothetical protein